MSNNFFQRLTTLKGIYFHQMSCKRDAFSAKISLKEHFWRDLIGVWKITLLSKDPVHLMCGNWRYLHNEPLAKFITTFLQNSCFDSLQVKHFWSLQCETNFPLTSSYFPPFSFRHINCQILSGRKVKCIIWGSIILTNNQQSGLFMHLNRK